ncbi:MAG: UDP-N-acetylmuramoylalanine--D-glutamate ligase [uncultured Thermomicrobiales bacterium]|uniref:UDP-N-acetylmuramoylalanine--D-glutamate ligase n=1 Tax=uncultured Thermomicrobiales bacterium TaxID=1645740 RepID=A0A6J4VXF3_9BACT|nr:MAG: UDP-N-acetylmuramoylalanine--D-glutamate ligase [uncultured Thermomicrobiales bacterium]
MRYDGARATVMGLGTRGGGVGVARYLAEHGARVTVTDGKPAAELAEPLAALADLPIRFALGGHREEDFTPAGADLVVRNPGVPRRAPMLALARRHGVPVEMEMTLFFRACPAPIVGVTGTKGKTTVASLCGELLRAWDPRTVLAGNMGVSALGQLPRIAADTPVVIELSSWQLEGLDEHRLAPHVAVLTNISEDHLDAYDGFADYAATKRTIAHHQRPDDLLVVNADDRGTWRAAAETRARVAPFGLDDRGGDGAWRAGDRLLWRWAGAEVAFDLPETPALAGEHNAANGLAAIAAAMLRGADPAAVRAGLGRFAGVRDRMEPVAEVGGVLFVNDTTATAPVAAVAALRSLAGRRVHLLAGGADKRLDLAPLAVAAVEAAAVYLLDGTATPALAALLRGAGVEPLGPFGGMDAAVAAAAAAARTGDVVLLSPGTASFGLFRDEFDRGERFREAVRAVAAAGAVDPAPPTLPRSAVTA